MNSQRQPAYEKSVFINCPFDAEFRDLMLAIVFTVAAHGLVPRSARETDGSAQPRFSRILQAISESKYSIHDLSRSTGEGGDNLARFNMPLELGMSAAFQFERKGSGRPHHWLALVPEGFAYQRFISDLAGFDPGRHDQSVASVIREVCAWLHVQEDVMDPPPSALRIYERFAPFKQQLTALRTEALEKETWAHISVAAYRTAPKP
jgi:hypothetical protein